jgi:hypothetical protein
MRTALILTSLLMASTGAAHAQQARPPADELVRQVVANELRAANAPGHYMYTMRKQASEGSETKEMIETKDWLIGRSIRIDGKPLTPEQRKKEDQRLTRVLSNPSLLQKERKDQLKDENRVRALFRALPDAFHYEYAEGEKAGNRDDPVTLSFHPNPRYSSPTSELRALEGMEGTMLIDAASSRIVRVNATLIRPASFALGIVARLDRGGSFLLEQRNVGSGRWQMTTLVLHFTGKILFFKSHELMGEETMSELGTAASMTLPGVLLGKQ